ncbi:ABC transporter ATP-binding protein [Mollicutes bacterium LVI A0078]|nr:ABC transporter ATP-binding protein [Mollicutes bacterium LVI A0075]WOO91818.1 ABC transporter ATP-binding protein [Mollicutes bacterium LVI A0078]
MVKQLMGYYKQNLKLFIGVMFTCFMIIIFQTLIPIGTRLILNEYIPSENGRGIIIISIILLVATLLLSFASYIKTYYGHVLGANIEKKMRVKMFKHFQTLDFSYYDKYKTGQILSRLTTDLNYISEFAHHGAEEVFSTIVIVVIGVFYLGSINVMFMLFSYLLIIVHFTVLYKNRGKMKQSMRAVRDELGEVNAKTESSLAAIRLTRTFTNETLEIEQYIDINESYRTFWKKAFKDLAVVMSTNNFFLQAQNVLLIGVGSIAIFNQIITFGDLMAFYLFFQILISSVSRIMNMIESFQQGVTSMDRYNDVMAVKPTIIENANPVALENVQGNIEFNNVSFEYVSDKPVISNLSLSVPSGKMVALVGESGIGKSTIIQLLPRFYDTTAGTITIDGIDIKDCSLETLRDNIGYVQQDVTLFYGSIRDNILYGKPEATEAELLEAVKRAKLDQFVASLELGLDTQVGEKGIVLSGGQKQRISLARIFLKNPPILLLDEATSALDTITERYIQKQIEELSVGRTVIVVAHRLTTIMKADQILVLGSEGIIESGTHSQLMENEGYYYQLQKSADSELY